MDASTWAAWWGAVVGSIAVAWQVFCWSRSGPRLKVRVSANMISITPGQPVDETLYINVDVVNVGDRPTTLTSLCGETYKNRFGRIWRKRQKAFVVNTGPESPIPYKLGVGERWSAMTRQEGAKELAGSSLVYMGVLHASQSKAKLKLVHFDEK